MRMGMQKWMTVKKRKKKEKERKKNDSLLVRACRWACGHVADGRAWLGLRVDGNGCKQRKGERKKKKNGLTAGGGHEHAVRTLFEVFEHCQTRTNCSNSVQTVGNECIISPNTVRTVPNKDKLFEHCSNSTPPHGGLFEHSSNSWKWVYNISEHCPNSVQTACEAVRDVRTLFEQHTATQWAVRTRFKQLEVGL